MGGGQMTGEAAEGMAAPENGTKVVNSRSVAETQQLGALLGGLLVAGDRVYLSGDLGAGKTALTVGIGRGWGVAERVNSPTFVFVHEHDRARDGAKLHHVDCYRLRGPEDAESIGLDEILNGESVVVIEWPERVQPILPSEALYISLTAGEDHPPAGDDVSLENSETRRLVFWAVGRRATAVLAELSRLTVMV